VCVSIIVGGRVIIRANVSVIEHFSCGTIFECRTTFHFPCRTNILYCTTQQHACYVCIWVWERERERESEREKCKRVIFLQKKYCAHAASMNESCHTFNYDMDMPYAGPMSIWTNISAHAAHFRNPNYTSAQSPAVAMLRPRTDPDDLEIWRRYMNASRHMCIGI